MCSQFRHAQNLEYNSTKYSNNNTSQISNCLSFYEHLLSICIRWNWLDIAQITQNASLNLLKYEFEKYSESRHLIILRFWPEGPSTLESGQYRLKISEDRKILEYRKLCMIPRLHHSNLGAIHVYWELNSRCVKCNIMQYL